MNGCTRIDQWFSGRVSAHHAARPEFDSVTRQQVNIRRIKVNTKKKET